LISTARLIALRGIVRQILEGLFELPADLIQHHEYEFHQRRTERGLAMGQ